LRLLLLSLVVLLLAGCTERLAPAGPVIDPPREVADAFLMPDGMRLPYRAWLPADEPWAVVLALHGMNDSRDAWEYPAPYFAQHGVAIFAPDQRGFGATSVRGYWPTTEALVEDCRVMARLLRQRYPHAKLFLMGESMGAAVLMVAGASADPPPADGYILIAPAVWGRAEMNVFLRATLWAAMKTVPGLKLSGSLARRVASDNHVAIRRLSMDPLTIKGTRVDAIDGLVNLMDAALAAAPHFHERSLFLYGGKDELIPDKATAATWCALPVGPRRAFYPAGYHLLLRDTHRITPIDDILAWMHDPERPLLSGADRAAQIWLQKQKSGAVQRRCSTERRAQR
jgi:acylglycerol lipase